MAQDDLFERLWSGAAEMEDWTAAVSQGAVTEVAEGIVTVHTTYFCGSVSAIRTTEGLVLIDTAKPDTARRTLEIIRAWDAGPIHTVIYTHGHIDHTSGILEIDAEAERNGHPRPQVVAHRNVKRRLDRYRTTQGFNSIVQGQQFNFPDYVYPVGQRGPDLIYDEDLVLEIGGRRFELHHGKGETDDATFVWLPRERVLASGDFVIWMFPNAGNPRKVQRYAPDWAVALRQMQALAPDVLIPGHGPVVFGAGRVQQMLGDGARVLEHLTRETVALMNQGAGLNEILHAVQVPEGLLSQPWLRPKYDAPEFLVRGIYHLYAGWFDGNPAHLKPARDADLGAEIAALAGGSARLAERALALVRSGETRLAAHLAGFAADASPEDAAIQAARAEVLAACVKAEPSLIGKAIFAVHERQARQGADS